MRTTEKCNKLAISKSVLVGLVFLIFRRYYLNCKFYDFTDYK